LLDFHPATTVRLFSRFAEQQTQGPQRSHRDKFKRHHFSPAQRQVLEQRVRLCGISHIHQKHRAGSVGLGEPLVYLASQLQAKGSRASKGMIGGLVSGVAFGVQLPIANTFVVSARSAFISISPVVDLFSSDEVIELLTRDCVAREDSLPGR
jgi:hypothetical protein